MGCFRSHKDTPHDSSGGRYSDAHYEPFGNRLVLAYTSVGGGEETIFNGGDAVYDLGAQTLTTADEHVYERVSYGGGLKIPPRLQMYDLFDWNSPNHKQESDTAAIIAAWQENDEEVDPALLDVDGLIAAIEGYEADDDDYDKPLFAIACALAGVDYDSYFVRF